MAGRFSSTYFGRRGERRPRMSSAKPTPASNLTSSQNQLGSTARSTTLAPSQVFPVAADPAAYESTTAPRLNRTRRLALRGMLNIERRNGPMQAKASQKAPPRTSSVNSKPSTVAPVEADASSASRRRVIPTVKWRLLRGIGARSGFKFERMARTRHVTPNVEGDRTATPAAKPPPAVAGPCRPTS